MLRGNGRDNLKTGSMSRNFWWLSTTSPTRTLSLTVPISTELYPKTLLETRWSPHAFQVGRLGVLLKQTVSILDNVELKCSAASAENQTH